MYMYRMTIDLMLQLLKTLCWCYDEHETNVLLGAWSCLNFIKQVNTSQYSIKMLSLINLCLPLSLRSILDLTDFVWSPKERSIHFSLGLLFVVEEKLCERTTSIAIKTIMIDATRLFMVIIRSIVRILFFNHKNVFFLFLFSEKF